MKIDPVEIETYVDKYFYTVCNTLIALGLIVIIMSPFIINYFTKYYKEKLYTEEEREKLWIQKQEEGYKFIMGEKYKIENQEDEKQWEKIIQYYRIYCIKTYKDNPKNWQIRKEERKNAKKRGYRSREKKEREQYYT